MFTENKQKKGKKKKAKISPNNLIIKNQPKDVTKQNKKTKTNSTINEENDEVNSEEIASSPPVNSKKARLKSLLNNVSHRTPINTSDTGNKLRNRMLERLKGMFPLSNIASLFIVN